MVSSATAIGRASGLSLITVCELLENGWTFEMDRQGSRWMGPSYSFIDRVIEPKPVPKPSEIWPRHDARRGRE